MPESNEMELIGTALQNFDRVAAGLALLEKNFKGVLYEVDTPMGMAHAKAARASIREPRYEVERLRKDAKAPILALGKRLDAEATRITNALLTLETPIDEQIKSEEGRREQERLAKIAAENSRIASIQAAIDEIRNWPVKAAGKSSALVEQMCSHASDHQITESVFQERTEEAKQVLQASLAALSGIHADRMAAEAEAARIIKERAELATLRAEQDVRDKASRAVQAKLDQEAAAKRQQEEARLNAERQILADEQAAHRARQQAEDKRLSDERAEFERKQEAARIAALPKPVKKPKQNPGAEAIADVVAGHYGVSGDVARRWLKEIDWEAVAA